MSEAKQLFMEVSLAAQKQSFDAMEALNTFRGPQGEPGNLTDEMVKNAIDSYFEKNPVETGATPEQVKQIEANTDGVASNKQAIENLTAEDVGALPSDGTAADANKLNGKDAKYYSRPRNLLANSDFEIAQAGYGGYHGAVIYAADRWMQNDTTVRTYEKVTHNGHGALKCASATRVQQKLYLVEGQTYTGAFYINDKLYLHSFTANGGSSGSGEIWINKQSDGTYMFIISGIPAGGVVSEPVLYPGTYTADNLPPYIPKGYAAELAACNVADTGCIDRTLINENTTYVATGFPANPTSASNTVFTTPADGIFYLFATRGETAGNTIRVYVLKPSGETVATFNIPAYYPYAMCCLTIPVKRGMKIKVDTDKSTETWTIREQKFFY